MSDRPGHGPSGEDSRRRLAAALRPIITMAVASQLDDDAVIEAAEAIEAVGGRLAARAGPKRPRQQPDISREPQEFFPTSPIMGVANPIVGMGTSMFGPTPRPSTRCWERPTWWPATRA